HPLPGATSVAMMEHGESALAPPDSSRVPVQIARAVMRGLEKERSKRFPTMAALVTELTPPPERARGRYAVGAALGRGAGASATAAVMSTQHETKRIEQPPDEETVRVLIDRINQLETEVKKLKKKVDEDKKKVLAAEDMHAADLRELEREKQLADEKEHELQA